MMVNMPKLAATAFACLHAAVHASIQHDHRAARVSADGLVLPPQSGSAVVRRARPASPEFFAAEEEEQFLSSTENPAGCVKPREKGAQRDADKYLAQTLKNVYPLDEFREMLETRKGTLYFNGTKDLQLSTRLSVPFCAEPDNSLPEEQDANAVSSITEALQGLDPDKPVILAFAEVRMRHDFKMLQIMSLICGFKRLGIEKQVLFFTMTNQSAVFLRSMHPWLRVLYHDGLTNQIQAAGQRANIPGNRVAKLVVSKMLLDLNREVILTDLDVHWLQDPTEHLRSIRTPDGQLADMAAMKDNCWLELNSGFLYYRPTDRTRALLHMALSTKKFFANHPDDVKGEHPNQKVSLISDNDQYLLNCALARSAMSGLQYVILPREQFSFGGINEKCRAAPRYYSAPMIWHTSGFSGTYEEEFDRFVAMGMVDFNASTSTCLSGKRGSAENMKEADSKVSRLCINSDPNAILVKKCYGSCSEGLTTSGARNMLSEQDFVQSLVQKELLQQAPVELPPH
jgi:hypothetical protein